MDTQTLESFAKEPALARAQVLELLAIVNSKDETTANWCTEVLENCGTPDVGCGNGIVKFLATGDPTQAYWAATLIGRMVAEHQDSSDVLDANSYQTELCKRFVSALSEESVRERIVWAIAQFQELQPETKDLLEKSSGSKSPRLNRLIEQALTTHTTIESR